MEIEATSGEFKKLSMDDFYNVSVIGKGSYAKVLLVRRKTGGELYALKMLKKELIEKKKQENHIMVERNALKEVDHPFIIKFKGSFQNEKKLYFLLEYCPGGELFHLLQKKRRFSEEQARFYAAQMVLALEHLHSKKILYRDLKPENVLIDQKGYIRITDFGLSRMNVEGNDSKSICGTPEYLAPEIILKLGYGNAVDWWTLGSIIYEMIIGIPPFYTNDRHELFDKIKFSNPRYPSQLPPNLKNILESLLKKDPTKRLGYKSADEIKTHPWFKDVNWDALYNKKYDAPFEPKIANDDDLQHFDAEFTEMPISMSANEGTNIFRNYDGFTYDPDRDMKSELMNNDDEKEGEGEGESNGMMMEELS